MPGRAPPRKRAFHMSHGDYKPAQTRSETSRRLGRSTVIGCAPRCPRLPVAVGIAVGSAIRLRGGVDRFADGAQELALGIGMGRMGPQGEGKDGIELAKLGNNLFGAISEFDPGILERLLLPLLERAHYVKAGEIFKFRKGHFLAICKDAGVGIEGEWISYPYRSIRFNVDFRWTYLAQLLAGMVPERPKVTS